MTDLHRFSRFQTCWFIQGSFIFAIHIATLFEHSEFGYSADNGHYSGKRVMSIQPHSCIQTNPPTSYLPPKLFSRVVKLAFPVALQSALVAILALADVLMVSDFGQTATAAVGIASRWHFVAIMIMAALATATGTLVSQYWGATIKKPPKPSPCNR